MSDIDVVFLLRDIFHSLELSHTLAVGALEGRVVDSSHLGTKPNGIVRAVRRGGGHRAKVAVTAVAFPADSLEVELPTVSIKALLPTSVARTLDSHHSSRTGSVHRPVRRPMRASGSFRSCCIAMRPVAGEGRVGHGGRAG
jgi:hypothetical protein